MTIIILDSIQAGCFQNRFRDGQWIITPEVRRLITEFYKILPPRMTCSSSVNLVYRALFKVPARTQLFPHPLPFSTTTSLAFANEWLFGTSGKVILEIGLGASTPYLEMHYKDEYEVVLPPGLVVCIAETETNDIRYCKCAFTPYLNTNKSFKQIN